MTRSRLLGVLPLLVLAACASNRGAAIVLVRIHAEKDLQCASDRIEVRGMLGGRYRATGCGRSAVYNSACEGLQCQVANEDEAAPAWRDRPDPGSLESDR